MQITKVPYCFILSIWSEGLLQDLRGCSSRKKAAVRGRCPSLDDSFLAIDPNPGQESCRVHTTPSESHQLPEDCFLIGELACLVHRAEHNSRYTQLPNKRWPCEGAAHTGFKEVSPMVLNITCGRAQTQSARGPWLHCPGFWRGS